MFSSKIFFFIKPVVKVYVLLCLIKFVIIFPRFLFILLGPKGKAKSYHEIGRAIATLMSDEVRTDESYKMLCPILLHIFIFFVHTTAENGLSAKYCCVYVF